MDLSYAEPARIQPARQSVQVWLQSQRAHQSVAQLGARKAILSCWLVVIHAWMRDGPGQG